MTASVSGPRRAFFGCFVTILIVAVVRGPSGAAPQGVGQGASHRVAATPVAVHATVQPTAELPVDPILGPMIGPSIEPVVELAIQAPLADPGLDLHAGPVDVPLELRIPSLGVNASVVGVGLTAENVMDAPKGLAADPVWQKAFWYRGSGIPGDSGTATFAGHVDDLLGRPAAFARIGDLRSGDLIVVHDTRTDLDIRFTVTGVAAYSVQQAADPSVLAQIYGSGPIGGKGPQPAPDGLAHLTLITCAGGWVNGSYDRRLVVYATRSEVAQCQFTWRDRSCIASAEGSSPCCY